MNPITKTKLYFQPETRPFFFKDLSIFLRQFITMTTYHLGQKIDFVIAQREDCAHRVRCNEGGVQFPSIQYLIQLGIESRRRKEQESGNNSSKKYVFRHNESNFHLPSIVKPNKENNKAPSMMSMSSMTMMPSLLTSPPVCCPPPKYPPSSSCTSSFNHNCQRQLSSLTLSCSSKSPSSSTSLSPPKNFQRSSSERTTSSSSYGSSRKLSLVPEAVWEENYDYESY